MCWRVESECLGVDTNAGRLVCARACAVRLKGSQRECGYFCWHERISLVWSVCVAVQPSSLRVSRDEERMFLCPWSCCRKVANDDDDALPDSATKSHLDSRNARSGAYRHVTTAELREPDKAFICRTATNKANEK